MNSCENPAMPISFLPSGFHSDRIADCYRGGVVRGRIAIADAGAGKRKGKANELSLQPEAVRHGLATLFR